MISIMNTLRQLGSRSRAKSVQWAQFCATMLFAAVVTALLVLGARDANRLEADSSALQLATQLSDRPDLLAAQLTLIQRGLESRTYVGRPLRELAVLQQSTSRALAGLRAALSQAGLLASSDVAGSLRGTALRWQTLDRALAGITGQSGEALYIDGSTGSRLSMSGKTMKSAVDGMLITDAQDMQQMRDATNQLGALLRAAVDDSGLTLRTLLIGGSALAGLMLGLMLYYAWRSRLARRAAAQAEQQVADILGTVREGLFLIDRQMRLTATHSDSLREVLRRPAPAGLLMQELLEPLVDARTISATLKYLGLLWNDKIHEELIESVNPLGEIETTFANPRGGHETRHLAFSFRRVRSVPAAGDASAAGDYVLGVVADITDRVLLARELQNVRAEGDSQAALQSQLLRVAPEALHAFIWSAEVALRESNTVLKSPGIGPEDLKRKLNAVFRELHTVKGEASALALDSFVQRIHAVEETLSALRQRGSLAGDDFLPLVLRLDELISHLGQIRALHERIGPLQLLKGSAPADDECNEAHGHTVALERPASLTGAASPPRGRGQLFAEMLRTLTLEEARALGRSARLLTRGLAEIPPHYATVVKEICIQMIRNAIAHGIEPPAQRARLGKPEEGTVQISFGVDEVGEYALTVEDDGQGINYEQIVDRALQLDLLSPQQALTLDWDSMCKLIFQPGLSTADQVSEHAGRGVGLDAVSARVREIAGEIAVTTAVGQYTRFRVLLPPLAGESAASVA